MKQDRQALWLTPGGDAAIVRIPVGEAGLNDLYHALDCRMIDIVQGWLETEAGRVLVDIVCDDEGLLVDSPQLNHVASHMRGGAICGTVLVFAEADSDGEMQTLDDATLDALENELMGVKRYHNVNALMGDIHARLML